MGDISENIPGEKRRKVIEWLYSIYPYLEGDPTFADQLMQNAKDAFEEAYSRISTGESVRIWYSNRPDELCGLYWFVSQIHHLELQSDQVILVSLPDWEICDDGNVRTHSGWGAVSPGDWHRYLGRQKAASPAFRDGCVSHWKRLQEENAPLRAMLNGRLVSAPETLYDEFILREIAAEEKVFNEARVVGKVLSKYELGVREEWVAWRIESMISAGSLTPVTEAAHGDRIYQRKLEKCM